MTVDRWNPALRCYQTFTSCCRSLPPLLLPLLLLGELSQASLVTQGRCGLFRFRVAVVNVRLGLREYDAAFVVRDFDSLFKSNFWQSDVGLWMCVNWQWQPDVNGKLAIARSTMNISSCRNWSTAVTCLVELTVWSWSSRCNLSRRCLSSLLVSLLHACMKYWTFDDVSTARRQFSADSWCLHLPTRPRRRSTTSADW